MPPILIQALWGYGLGKRYHFAVLMERSLRCQQSGISTASRVPQPRYVQLRGKQINLGSDRDEAPTTPSSQQPPTSHILDEFFTLLYSGFINNGVDYGGQASGQ